MKAISTTVNSGDVIEYAGRTCRIGVIRNGKIQFTIILSQTSSITEYITTRELNKRLSKIYQPSPTTTR